jgi:tRNA uridine 5-carboxymethylaminomethyl modification enzyme
MESRGECEQLELTQLDFARVASLSKEGLSALEKARPATLGAAQRLRGVRDSDITALLIYLKTQTVSRETNSA